MGEGASQRAVVEVRDLSAGFGEHTVLRGVDFDLHRGEILSVVGASGSGKTTLLRQIIGLGHRPMAGSIAVLGQPVHDADTDTAIWLRRNWGVLFQSGALFSAFSVFDNIAFPLRELAKSGHRVSEADIRALVLLKLEMVGLEADIAWHLPAALSGGMAKRVALARALALDADLLFLDEPTSGLDPDSAAEFDRLLGELRGDLRLSALMVTHDISSLAALSDRIVVLNEGRMLTIGTLDEIVHIDDPFIKRFFHGARGEAVLDNRNDKA